MSKKYCYCGKINDLTANFCMGCGKPFTQLAASSPAHSPAHNPKPITPTKSRTEIDEDDDDDYDEDDRRPSLDNLKLSKLDLQIESSKPSQSNVKDLMSTGSDAAALKMVNQPKPVVKVNKKTVLNELKKEASAIRPKD